MDKFELQKKLHIYKINNNIQGDVTLYEARWWDCHLVRHGLDVMKAALVNDCLPKEHFCNNKTNTWEVKSQMDLNGGWCWSESSSGQKYGHTESFFRISKSMTTRKFDLTKSALYGYGECFSEYHDSHQIWTDANREFMHMETVIFFREKNYGKNTSHFKGKNAV